MKNLSKTTTEPETCSCLKRDMRELTAKINEFHAAYMEMQRPKKQPAHNEPKETSN